MSQILAVYMAGLILRSIGIALIAGICCWKIRNAAVRHAVWVAVLGAMLLLPICDYFLPAEWVPARFQQIKLEQSIPFHIVTVRSPGLPLTRAESLSSVSILPIPTRSLDWWAIASALCVLVAVAMFVRLFLGYRKIRQLMHRSGGAESLAWDEILAAQDLRFRIPTLMVSEEVQVPMTVGFIRPAVILPTDWKVWDDWKLRAVLVHEMAHVRRGDWGIAVLAAASRCAFWLNPLSWFLERQLAQLAEQSSDDASLVGMQDATRYAEILLEFAAAVQNGRRLMRGGVAMAQHRMKVRIERVLGNPVSGTGIVKITGWIMVLIVAAPVIYSAAALQVAPKLAQDPTAPSQIVSAAAEPVVEQEKRIPLPVRTRNQQQRLAEVEPNLQALMEQKSANAAPAQEPPSPSYNIRRIDFQQVESYNAQAQLNIALQQVSPTIPPSAPATLQVQRNNEEDLLAYLKQLAQLRVSFSISVTGIQGRTINMKVAGQDYSLGCEKCSFFVGESAVSSATPAPSEPGAFLRLSPDGNSLDITCHAAKCSVSEYEVLGVGSEQLSNLRQLESGLTEVFRTSKPLRVVISKN